MFNGSDLKIVFPELLLELVLKKGQNSKKYLISSWPNYLKFDEIYNEAYQYLLH
jgi:hypothetical protein